MTPANFKNTFGRAAFFFLALSVFALAGCGEKTTAAPVKAEVKAAAPRTLAPPFTIKTLDGKTFSLASLRGAPVVVNFWASWCTPCAIEAPVLENTYKRLKGRGVGFIAVAVEDTKKDARKFASLHGLTFPVGLDESGDVMSSYRANLIPQTYVIDADGYVVYVKKGIVDEETLVKEIAKVLPPVPAGSADKEGKQPAPKKTTKAS